MSEASGTHGGRLLEGRVISAKMDKTVTVEVTRTVKHARYHKYITRRNTYKAHDEDNACEENDIVVIRESRPLSKTKRWTVVDRRSTGITSDEIVGGEA